MKKLIWPEVAQPNVCFECHRCQTIISVEVAGVEGDRYWFTPASRYWIAAQHRVYCGVTCLWEDLNATDQG